MTDRDRLIEIMLEAKNNEFIMLPYCDMAAIADHLLANGVIVPPCKVGDTTFLLLEKTSGGYDVVESKCVAIY